MFIVGALLFVGFFAFLVFTTGPRGISYNQFLDLVERGQIAKLSVIGATKVIGEVRNPDDPSLKDLNLNSGRFSTVLPKSENPQPFIREIIAKDQVANREAITKKDAKPIEVLTEEDQSAWVTPVVYFLLPMALIAVVIFFMYPTPRSDGRQLC